MSIFTTFGRGSLEQNSHFLYGKFTNSFSIETTKSREHWAKINIYFEYDRLLFKFLFLNFACPYFSCHLEFFVCFTAFCLKDLKIFVPEAVITGNAATLSCQYELEQVSICYEIHLIWKVSMQTILTFVRFIYCFLFLAFYCVVVILLHLNSPQILNEIPPAKHAHTLHVNNSERRDCTDLFKWTDAIQ